MSKVDKRPLLAPRYVGMTRADAPRLRFGSELVPDGLTVVLVENALRPDGGGLSLVDDGPRVGGVAGGVCEVRGGCTLK